MTDGRLVFRKLLKILFQSKVEVIFYIPRTNGLIVEGRKDVNIL